MANSTIISTLKNKVIKELINDELIVKVIDSPDIDTEGWDPSCMLNTKENEGFQSCVFTSYQNPEIIAKAITFICVEVNIPRTYEKIYNKPTLTIAIFSHNEHMRIDNIEGVKDNRNDYLSMLIDRKLNGTVAGYGELELVKNIAGVHDKNFLFRELTFETLDLNKSLCDD